MDAGREAADVARELGLSKDTLSAGKLSYGGMDGSEAQEAKRLREENTKWRKLVADIGLDKEARQIVISGKGTDWLPALSAAVDRVKETFETISERGPTGSWVVVSSFRYRWTQSDAELRREPVEPSRQRPPGGYRWLHAMLAGRHRAATSSGRWTSSPAC